MQIDGRLFLGSVAAAALQTGTPDWECLSSGMVINAKAMIATCSKFSRTAWLRAPTFVSIDGECWTVCSDQRVLVAVRGRQEFSVELDSDTDREQAIRHLHPFLRPEYLAKQMTTLRELRNWCRTAPYHNSQDEFENIQRNVGSIGSSYFDRDLLFKALRVLDSQSSVRLMTNAVSTAMQVRGPDFMIYVMPLSELPDDAKPCPPFEEFVD